MKVGRRSVRLARLTFDPPLGRLDASLGFEFSEFRLSKFGVTGEPSRSEIPACVTSPEGTALFMVAARSFAYERRVPSSDF